MEGLQFPSYRPIGAPRLRPGCLRGKRLGRWHRRLARNLDVVLVGAEEGLPGPLLPRGPFREPARALRRAQAVIVTRKEASAERAHGLMRQVRELAPEAVVGQVHLRPGELTPLVGGTQDQAASPPGGRMTWPRSWRRQAPDRLW